MATDGGDVCVTKNGSDKPLIRRPFPIVEHGPFSVRLGFLTETGKEKLEGLCPNMRTVSTKDGFVVKSLAKTEDREQGRLWEREMKIEIDILRSLPRSPLLNLYLCCLKEEIATETGGSYFSYSLLSELVGGDEMFEIIKKEGARFGRRKSIRTGYAENGKCIVWLLYLAVGALHRDGVYHRDLKPENIIIRKWGDNGIVEHLGRSDLRELVPEAFLPLAKGGSYLGIPAIPCILDYGNSCLLRGDDTPIGSCGIGAAGTPYTQDPWLIDRMPTPYTMVMGDYFSLAMTAVVYFSYMPGLNTCRTAEGRHLSLMPVEFLKWNDGKRCPSWFSRVPEEFLGLVDGTIFPGCREEKGYYFRDDMVLYRTNKEALAKRDTTGPPVVEPLDSSIASVLTAKYKTNFDLLFVDISSDPSIRIQPEEIAVGLDLAPRYFERWFRPGGSGGDKK